MQLTKASELELILQKENKTIKKNKEGFTG
jgi:hypothetical protein